MLIKRNIEIKYIRELSFVKQITIVPVWIIGCFVDQEGSKVFLEEFYHIRLQA